MLALETEMLKKDLYVYKLRIRYLEKIDGRERIQSQTHVKNVKKKLDSSMKSHMITRQKQQI